MERIIETTAAASTEVSTEVKSNNYHLFWDDKAEVRRS